MRRRLFLAGIALAALALAGCGGGGGGATPAPGRSLVVRIQPGADPDALAAQFHLTVQARDDDAGVYRFGLRAGDDAATLAAQLKTDSRCAEAEGDDPVKSPEQSRVDGFPIHVPFDFVPPKHARFPGLSAAFAAGGGAVNTAVGAQIDLDPALAQTRGAGVVVAVLDTGAKLDHPALASHLLPGYNAIDPTLSPAEVRDGATQAAFGHGTMVAGIVAQVAPDAKILPVRVLDADGVGTVFDVARGIHWAATHGAKVINLSFGTETPSGALQHAIDEARNLGAVVVASAGNTGQDLRDYPAGYSDVVSVAALESDDTKAPYSNFGSHIQISAPGTGIHSTYADGGFAAWSGTSFAAPLVSGAAALVRAAYPAEDAGFAIDALTRNARSIDAKNPTFHSKLGRGILDVAQALATP